MFSNGGIANLGGYDGRLSQWCYGEIPHFYKAKFDPYLTLYTKINPVISNM
jgi:hypothetical protein